MNRNPEDRPEVSQYTELSGDHNQIGSVNQIGAQHNYYGTSSEDGPVELDFGAKWSWKSPFTQAILGWTSLFFSIFSAASFYKLFRSVLDSTGTAIASPSTSYWVWFVLFVVCLATFALASTMWRIVRLRLHAFAPVSFLPVATESEGHFAVAKYQGRCPRCDGKLRFYSKPVAWRTVPTSGGGTKEKVANRVLAAECRRNHEHWWKLDPTDTIV